MRVTFLGQAGVAVEEGGALLLIDPYLSDNLSLLSAGFWARSVPIPVDPVQLRDAVAIVATHEHADHLDPLTVAPMLARSPAMKLLAPVAALASLPWPADPAQLQGLRGEGEQVTVGPFTVRALPAAHSTGYALEHTPGYGHRWCSVVVEAGGRRLFHAGDTVDWAGFAEAVGPVDVACVPVNGRGREEHDIIGNLTEAEAADLVRRLPARHALPIHWDMFAVNPGDPELFRRLLHDAPVDVHVGPAMTSFVVG